MKNSFTLRPLMPVAWVVMATLGCSTVALVGCGKKDAAGAGGAAGQQMPPTVVNVLPVQFQTIPLITELSGRTVAYQEATVTPQVTGIIEQQLFREGGFVRQGQPLYRLNQDNYTSSMASSQADLEKAKAAQGSAAANVYNAQAALKSSIAQNNLAQAKLARLASLLHASVNGTQAISQQEYDVQKTEVETTAAAVESAKGNLAVAQAGVSSAAASTKSVQAAIDASKLNINRTTITAPISGVASRPLVNVGALVTAGQTQIMTISRLDPVYVDISQSAAELLALRQKMMSGQVGQSHTAEVQLKLADGSIYPLRGQLSFEEAKVDPATGAVNLRAVFRNPDGMLLPGMFVNAQVMQGVINNGVLLPQSAVNRTAKGDTTVNIVDSNNKIQVRPVTINGTYQGKWIVTSGLKQGENVVIVGGTSTKPDQQVVVKPYVESEDTTNPKATGTTGVAANPAVANSAQAVAGKAVVSSTATTTTTTTVTTANPATSSAPTTMPIANTPNSPAASSPAAAKQ